MSSLLVLGIGNTLLRDDGAGVHAAVRLEPRLTGHAGSRVLDAGTLSFSLLPDVESCDALVVMDAAREGAAAGTVSVREGPAMDAFIRRRNRSVHEVGLSDLLDMARLAGCLPARRALIGIEPEAIDWGVGCSATVEPALARAVEAALELVERWSASPASPEVGYAA